MKRAITKRLSADLRETGCELREDLSGCRRCIKLEVFPRNCDQVARALQFAKRERVKVHPVSCGRNWGFGSELPVARQGMVLNLSRMNHICDWNPRAHTVEVEPGVTQGQMEQHLRAKNDTHFLNATGAGLSASVLGNALERGIGYFGSRDRDLIGASVVLATGEKLRLGHGSSDLALGAPLGPAVEGLLAQSGWAVVTSGSFRVHRRPEQMGAVVLELREEASLPEVIEEIGAVLAEGWIDSVPHIFNEARLRTTFGEECSWPAWSAVIPVRGPKQIVAATVESLERRFSRSCEIRTLNLEDTTEWSTPLTAINPLLEGRPIDLALFSMANAVGSDASAKQSARTAYDPEAGNAGLIHVTPSTSLEAERVRLLLRTVERSASRHGWKDLPLSFNVVTARYGCLVMSVCFKRDSIVQKRGARAFAQALLSELNNEGFRPYRLGLEQATQLNTFEPAMCGLYQRLQRAFDPENLLSPSRYHHLWSNPADDGIPVPSFLRMIEKGQRRTERTLCKERLVLS